MRDWEYAREQDGHCQNCGITYLVSPGSPYYNGSYFVVHHIRYTPFSTRVFICKKCHRNAHLFKKGYEAIWPLQRKPEGWDD